MGQTTKKIRTVIGTQAEYDAAKSSYAQDIFYATDSHRIYARGNTFGMVDEGPWYTLTPYLYQNSTVYYYYIKVAQMNTGSSSVFRTLEFDVHGDCNYPSGGRYLLNLNTYHAGNADTRHAALFGQGRPASRGRMEVYLDTSGGVWVRFPGIDWGNLVRFRCVLERGSVGTAIPFYTNPAKQTDKPANLSTAVEGMGGIKLNGTGTFSYEEGVLYGTAQKASSAVKLQTARKLWGQSFDGQADVSGDMTGVGKVSATGEVVSTSSNAFRLAAGNYGVILRNDGAQFYFLLTAKGQAAAGGWNNLRPFFINLQTGLVTMQNGLAVNGGLSANTASVSDDLHVGGEAAIDGDLHVGGNIDYPQVAHARLLIPYELYSLATGTQLADSHFAATEWKTLAGFKTALEKFSQYGTAVYVELGNSSSNTRRTQAVFQYRENTAGKYYTFAFSTSTSNVGDLSARLNFNLTKSTGVLLFGKSGV
jgi:hypothetical protein